MDKKDTYIEILSSSTIKEKYTYTKKQERYYSECKGKQKEFFKCLNSYRREKSDLCRENLDQFDQF